MCDRRLRHVFGVLVRSDIPDCSFWATHNMHDSNGFNILSPSGLCITTHALRWMASFRFTLADWWPITYTTVLSELYMCLIFCAGCGVIILTDCVGWWIRSIYVQCQMEVSAHTFCYGCWICHAFGVLNRDVNPVSPHWMGLSKRMMCAGSGLNAIFRAGWCTNTYFCVMDGARSYQPCLMVVRTVYGVYECLRFQHLYSGWIPSL